MTQIYLAGPIDYSGENDRVLLWRHLCQEALENRGWVVKDPSAVSWTRKGPMPPAEAIWFHNQTWIDQADGVLAFCPPDTVTVGTWMEVEYARAQKKPLVVVFNGSGYQLKGAGIKVYSIRAVKTAVDVLMETIHWREEYAEALTNKR